jgi:hypothetical protein
VEVHARRLRNPALAYVASAVRRTYAHPCWNEHSETERALHRTALATSFGGHRPVKTQLRSTTFAYAAADAAFAKTVTVLTSMPPSPAMILPALLFRTLFRPADGVNAGTASPPAKRFIRSGWYRRPSVARMEQRIVFVCLLLRRSCYLRGSVIHESVNRTIAGQSGVNSARSRMSAQCRLSLRLWLQSRFAPATKNSAGRRRGIRVKM